MYPPTTFATASFYIVRDLCTANDYSKSLKFLKVRYNPSLSLFILEVYTELLNTVQTKVVVVVILVENIY